MKFKAVSNEKRKLNLNWDHIDLYVSRYKPKTAFDVSVTRRQKKKSDPLRKYFFGVVMPPLLEETGYERSEAEEVHEHLKVRHFNVPQSKQGFYRKKDVPSVFGEDSDMPVSEKKAYVDYVVRIAASLGVYIPDPGE